MFNTLEEQIARTEGPAPSPGARAIRYVGVFVLSGIIFVALCVTMWLVE